MALHTAEELGLGHTHALVRVKQVMSALTDGRTEGVLEHLNVLGPEALEAGLGLALPFCELLAAWTHAMVGNTSRARAALAKVGNLKKIAVDPQVPIIIDFIEKTCPPEVNENIDDGGETLLS